MIRVTLTRLFHFAAMSICCLWQQQELAFGQPPYIPALNDGTLRRLR